MDYIPYMRTNHGMHVISNPGYPRDWEVPGTAGFKCRDIYLSVVPVVPLLGGAFDFPPNIARGGSRLNMNSLFCGCVCGGGGRWQCSGYMWGFYQKISPAMQGIYPGFAERKIIYPRYTRVLG